MQRDERLALLRLFARGDVPHHHDAVVRMLLGHGLAHHLDGNGVAIFMEDRDLVGVFAASAGVVVGHRAPLGADEVEDRHAQQLGHAVAREPEHGFVAVGDDAVPVEHDGFVRGLGELAHALFALPHLVFGAPAFGDVGDQHKRTQRVLLLVTVRDQVDLDHPQLAVWQRLLAGVFHMLALQALGDMWLDGQPGLLANGFLDRQPDNGTGGVAVVGRITLVSELAAQMFYIVISHQGGH